MDITIGEPVLDPAGSPYIEPDVGTNLERVVRTYSARVHYAQYVMARDANINVVRTRYGSVINNIQAEIDYLAEYSRKENRYIEFLRSNIEYLNKIESTIEGDAALLPYNNNLLFGEYKYSDRTNEGDPRYWGVLDHKVTAELVLDSRLHTKETIDAMLAYCVDLMAQLQELEEERD